jgi:hypothetical protein
MLLLLLLLLLVLSIILQSRMAAVSLLTVQACRFDLDNRTLVRKHLPSQKLTTMKHSTTAKTTATAPATATATSNNKQAPRSELHCASTRLFSWSCLVVGGVHYLLSCYQSALSSTVGGTCCISLSLVVCLLLGRFGFVIHIAIHSAQQRVWNQLLQRIACYQWR